MSRFKVEELCFDLGEPANAASFKNDPESFMARYNLTEPERRAITAGDIGALYKMGVVTQAIMCLSRAFGYDTAIHVAKLREAAGLPVNNKQLTILQKRQ